MRNYTTSLFFVFFFLYRKKKREIISFFNLVNWIKIGRSKDTLTCQIRLSNSLLIIFCIRKCTNQPHNQQQQQKRTKVKIL